MKSIVITGSSRGIGLGLAESFLRLGASVTLNGRSMEPDELERVETVTPWLAKQVLQNDRSDPMRQGASR